MPTTIRGNIGSFTDNPERTPEARTPKDESEGSTGTVDSGHTSAGGNQAATTGNYAGPENPS